MNKAHTLDFILTLIERSHALHLRELHPVAVLKIVSLIFKHRYNRTSGSLGSDNEYLHMKIVISGVIKVI